MAVARCSSGRVTKSQGEGAVLRVFLPTDNSLQSVRCKRDNSISAGNGVMGVHSAGEMRSTIALEVLVHGQVTIIFVVSVCLFVCLCKVFLSRL